MKPEKRFIAADLIMCAFGGFIVGTFFGAFLVMS